MKLENSHVSCITFDWWKMIRETEILNFSVEENRAREHGNDPVELFQYYLHYCNCQQILC